MYRCPLIVRQEAAVFDSLCFDGIKPRKVLHVPSPLPPPPAPSYSPTAQRSTHPWEPSIRALHTCPTAKLPYSQPTCANRHEDNPQPRDHQHPAQQRQPLHHRLLRASGQHLAHAASKVST